MSDLIETTLSPVTRFQCLGVNKNGQRCNNKFLTSKYSEELTCSKHKEQNVSFKYSSVKDFSKLHDIAKLIAIHINDPETFSDFSKVCLSTAKACHVLQDIKKKQFSQEKEINGVKMLVLPSGRIYKSQ